MSVPTFGLFIIVAGLSFWFGASAMRAQMLREYARRERMIQRLRSQR